MCQLGSVRGELRGTVFVSCDPFFPDYWYKKKALLEKGIYLIPVKHKHRESKSNSYLYLDILEQKLEWFLLFGEPIGESLEHFIFVFDAQLSATLFAHSLLPLQVLGLEN